MALSDVDICNLGLANIGHTEFLDAIGEDSVAGEVAKRFFEQDRDAVLRDFRWPFAKRIWMPAALVASKLKTTVVPDQWGYAFAYPDDCVDLRGVYPGVRNPREDQKVENELHNDGNLGRIILADVATPTLIGTARIVDTNQFAPDFADALAWRLSFRFATSVRKDTQLAKDAWAGYRGQLATAAANAAREVQLRRPEAPHIAARR